jgi:hypothetical protein
LEAGNLRDTGYNVIEMRLYLEDTTVFRTWYIDLDDSPVIPWARHAVKGVFMGSEENLRRNTAGMRLGNFQILERRLLSEAEMSFWKWSPVPGGDTAYEMEPELFPGDTVAFLTAQDEFPGGMTMRIRKDED